MAILTVCKRFTFEASHFLQYHPGKCANMHGHRFELEIEVKATDTFNGDMIIDFSDLKKVVQENIIKKVDHTVLNEVFPDFEPTAENLVRHFTVLLKGKFFIHNCILHRIKLHETENSFAEWRNE